MQAADPESLTTEELLNSAWVCGNVYALMHAGQKRVARQILAWWAFDQSEVVDEDGAIGLMYALAGGKRFGKTSLMLWLWHMLAVQFAKKYGRPLEMRFTSAFQKSIDEIIGKVKPQVFRTAPPSCEPQYFGKRGILPAGLYMPKEGPTLGASLALAGLDMNPNALRGQSSDGDFVSECAFITHLEYVVRNVLVHQYQGKPWARMVLESSAPEDMDTDWELVILPDAKRRNACAEVTIDDNPMLSEKQRAKYIAMAGGRNSPECRREYYNEIIGNPDMLCVPEFNEKLHVRDVERPKHAYALAGDDPGWRHFHGKVWAYYHFDLQAIVVEDSWGKTNASTIESAAVTAAREFDLYGRLPPTRMRSIPLDSDGERRGWRELLQGDRCEDLAVELYEIANLAPEDRPDFETRPGRWIREDRPGQWTHWDEARHEFMENPHARISDVDPRLIYDLSEQYGLQFQATTKTDLRTMIANVRRWVGQGRVFFLPTAGPVIQHTRAAKWDKTRSHLAEHKIYGHFDVFSPLVYLVRYVELIENYNPNPPPEMIAAQRGMPGMVVERPPWHDKHPYEIEQQQRIEEAEAMLQLEYEAEHGRLREAPRIRSYY
jgi:hypothetical protein